MYLTPSEYITYGGIKPLNHLELFKFQKMFESALYPNTYMVENFKIEKGEYPLEIKIAMVAFVNHVIKNGEVLFGIPIGGATVGTVSIDYNNEMLKSYGDMSKIITPEVRMILKTTNVLNPHAVYKQMKFRGTFPAFVNPLIEPAEEETISSDIYETGTDLPPLEEIYRDLPKQTITFFKPNNVSIGGSVVRKTNQVDFIEVGKAICTFEKVKSSDNTYGYVIVPPFLITGEEFFVDVDWKFEVEENNNISTFEVGEFHTYMNKDVLHHTRVTLQ